MARITVEDCLKKVNNRFTLIHMAAKRVRQLRKGAAPTIRSKNKDIVVSLREIAAGNIIKYEHEDWEENLLVEGEAAGVPEQPAERDTTEEAPAAKKEEEEVAEG